MPSKYLDNANTLLRYVSWAKLLKDEHDNVLGVLSAAFTLRENEKYLSATWTEHFEGSAEEGIERAIWTLRDSKLSVRPKSGFVIGNVGKIKDACHACDVKVRIIHEPEPDNEAHTALRNWPKGEGHELFELLVEGAWSQIVLNNNMRNKP